MEGEAGGADGVHPPGAEGVKDEGGVADAEEDAEDGAGDAEQNSFAEEDAADGGAIEAEGLVEADFTQALFDAEAEEERC